MDLKGRVVQNLDLKGKRVFIRVDFNVPVSDGRVVDDTRIQKAYKTIDYVLDQGGSAVLASHFKRPKGTGYEKDKSLYPVFQYLQAKYPGIRFAESCVGPATEAQAKALAPGDVLLLENLRFFKQEKANDQAFARDLARLADVYVNDAFGSSHRAHASIYSVPRYTRAKAVGFLIQQECENLSRLLDAGEHPYVAVMGGAKVSTKLSVLENLLKRVDTCLIGGGMAYTFLKLAGHTIGSSLFEPDVQEACRYYLNTYAEKLVLPTDHIAGAEFAENTPPVAVNGPDIADDLMGMDIGPKTLAHYQQVIAQAKTVFWNGPMGVFEFPAFSKGTMAIAHAIADSPAFSVIGGGESGQAVQQAGREADIHFISTVGGASLEFLGGVLLPGLEAILQEEE